MNPMSRNGLVKPQGLELLSIGRHHSIVTRVAIQPCMTFFLLQEHTSHVSWSSLILMGSWNTIQELSLHFVGKSSDMGLHIGREGKGYAIHFIPMTMSIIDSISPG